MFTLEEAECLADCDRAPCVQVNHRFVGDQTPESFDPLVDDLRAGRLADTMPPHGTLVRVRRSVALRADPGAGGRRAGRGGRGSRRPGPRPRPGARA